VVSGVTNADCANYTYGLRYWQEQAFCDLKSGGWRHESRVRHPDHVARLLVILTLVYAWCIALGAHACAFHRTYPLIRRATALPDRCFSLFKEGFVFLSE